MYMHMYDKYLFVLLTCAAVKCDTMLCYKAVNWPFRAVTVSEKGGSPKRPKLTTHR